jgi:hypothetical protein
MRGIFFNVPITHIDPPLTKKQKYVDKKKIVAEYGSVINVQLGNLFRGIDIQRKKKKWCTVCQPMTMRGGKEVKDLTVTEFSVRDPTLGHGDVWRLRCKCSKCQRDYDLAEIKKINHFLNQLTIVLSIGSTQPLVNVMMFRDNLKMAGCKNQDDGVEALLVIWQEYLVNMATTSKWKKYLTFDAARRGLEVLPEGGVVREGDVVRRTTEAQKPWTLADRLPKFVFEMVMRNVDFKLGFPIERSALNSLMNDAKWSHNVFMSQYESTGQTNVNVKMYSRKPDNFKYDCLVIPFDRAPYFTFIDEVLYKTPKKVNKQQYVTFIVFSSSEIILSGRYNQNMEEMYNFFLDVIFKNKSQIEERLAEIDHEEILTSFSSFQT